MISLETPDDFPIWREQAKQLVHARIEPSLVSWSEPSLFGENFGRPVSVPPELKVPSAFAALAETVFLHSGQERLDLLYRLLWRLQNNRHLLQDATDVDVVKAGLLVKAVRRDIHKMRAFVRFRQVAGPDGEDHYVAWFEPDHDIVRANAEFFTNRFGSMRWSILTPKRCLHWDTQELRETEGITKPAGRQEDPAEELWLGYYSSIFNPARLKTRAMLKEMPRRYWKNMPETNLIPGLIAGAQAREAAMISVGGGQSEAAPENWTELNEGINRCTRCPLHCGATQAVQGEGPQSARLMIVGEQPGDHEDRTGRPFIGPAGKMLDSGLAGAGLQREDAYLTNAVKHFKYERRGKLRLHQAPSAKEIDHCRWWLDAERQLVQPQLILALGASAFRAITGKTANISQMRGKPIKLLDGSVLIATTHPSYILRVGEKQHAKVMAEFSEDITKAAHFLGQ